MTKKIKNMIEERARDLEKTEMYDRHILRQLREMVIFNFGEEPEGWDEFDERFQAWKALKTFERLWEIDKK